MVQCKVLLVDDEEELVRTLAERLRMRSFDVGVALSGEESLQSMEKNVPDVMVLDLRMPGMEGMEVLRRVKKTYPHVQVIILTGHGSEQDEREARRLGAFEYLQKPVNIDHLAHLLNEAYQRKIA